MKIINKKIVKKQFCFKKKYNNNRKVNKKKEKKNSFGLNFCFCDK